MTTDPEPLKDDRLDAVAEHHNVAQFVSFGPGADPRVRHRRLRGDPPDPAPGADAAAAVTALLARAPGGANVRTFRPDHRRATRSTTA